MVCTVFFHFLYYCVSHYISRLKLICKPLTVFIKKNCTFAPYTFAYKEASALFLTVKSCRVNLNIVNILKFNTVQLFDAAPYATGSWYGRLQDERYFATVHLLPGGIGIEWEEGQDIAPHELYENSVPVKKTA